MTKRHKPQQINMFPDGADLPLFSGTPVRAHTNTYTPQPVAQQSSLAMCRVCLDTGRVGDVFCTCECGVAARKAAKPGLILPDKLGPGPHATVVTERVTQRDDDWLIVLFDNEDQFQAFRTVGRAMIGFNTHASGFTLHGQRMIEFSLSRGNGEPLNLADQIADSHASDRSES
jgi:hypothetical protein